MIDRQYELDGPLSLRWTLGLMSIWGASTWLRVDETGGWFARRTPDGPGTVHIVHRGDHLMARAYGDGAAHLLDDVPGLVGIGGTRVDAIEPHHSFVAEARRKMVGYRQGRTGQVYSRLVAVAIAQKVSGANAKPALRKIAWNWGERAPGPRDDMRLLPEPRKLARMPYYAFHPFGVEKKRADIVRGIAERARAIERAAKMPFPEARAHLEKLRGIGPWTSGVVMSGTLGDPDAVPIGDYHLPNYVAWNLAGEPRADDDRMMELLEPYAPYRGMVARMVKGGGKGAPKWGPRTSPVDIPD